MLDSPSVLEIRSKKLTMLVMYTWIMQYGLRMPSVKHFETHIIKIQFLSSVFKIADQEIQDAL